MLKITLKAADREPSVEVALDRIGAGAVACFEARVGGESHDVELCDDGSGSGALRIHGRIIPYHFVRTDRRIDVWLAGKVYPIEVAGKSARHWADHAHAAGGDELTAPMPGTILKINVTQGDTCDAGQPLVVMESMKMEMTLAAPRAGRIAVISCKVGELVDLGRVLVRLEATDNGQPA